MGKQPGHPERYTRGPVSGYLSVERAKKVAQSMSGTESGETDDSIRESPPTEGEIPHGKLFPLNSRRLTTVQLRKIAEGLGLPSSCSADETRQLIEGKLKDGQTSTTCKWLYMKRPQ